MTVRRVFEPYGHRQQRSPSSEGFPLPSPVLLLVQLTFLREHGKIAVRDGKAKPRVGDDHEGRAPFGPVGIVEFPRVKGHDRDGEGLNGHDVTVDGHADAGEDAAKVEQRRVGAALLREEEVCGQDAADHEFGEEEPLAVDPAVEHLIEGHAGAGQDVHDPTGCVDQLEHHVDGEHRPGDFAHELLHVPGDELAAGELP